MAFNTIEFARSQLEWMSPSLGAQFDSGRGHPFALRSVRICSSVAELDAVIDGSGGNPTVALASGATLDSGPARDLLLRWGGDQDNSIVLTDSSRCLLRGDCGSGMGRSEKGKSDPLTVAGAAAAAAAAEEEAESGSNLAGSALAPEDVSQHSASAQLLRKWCEAKYAREEMADVVVIDVPVPRRAPLAGPELQTFLAEEEHARRAKKRQEEQTAMLREVELARDRLRLGEEETGVTVSGVGSGRPAGGGTVSDKKRLASSLGAKQGKKKSRFDSNLFLKFSKPLHSEFSLYLGRLSVWL